MRRQGGNNLGRLDDVFHRIPGQIQYDVGAVAEGIGLYHHHGVNVFRHRVAPVDFLQRLVVDCLQAELDENIYAVGLFDVRHNIEIRRIDAVRPRRDGDADDVGPAGFDKVLAEHVGPNIGIGEILEIGDEFISLVFGLDMGDIGLYLPLYSHVGRQIFIPCADRAAEGAAPRAQRAVAVRARIGNADGQLIYLFAVPFFQIRRIYIISFVHIL